MKQFKIIISGGGTGGHIFPAISIAQAFESRYPGSDILFIGAKDKTTSSAHIAKTNRNYSIAGNTSGKVIVKEAVSEELINLNIGQQIIFGNMIWRQNVNLLMQTISIQ